PAARGTEPAGVPVQAAGRSEFSVGGTRHAVPPLEVFACGADTHEEPRWIDYRRGAGFDAGGAARARGRRQAGFLHQEGDRRKPGRDQGGPARAAEGRKRRGTPLRHGSRAGSLHCQQPGHDGRFLDGSDSPSGAESQGAGRISPPRGPLGQQIRRGVREGDGEGSQEGHRRVREAGQGGQQSGDELCRAESAHPEEAPAACRVARAASWRVSPKAESVIMATTPYGPYGTSGAPGPGSNGDRESQSAFDLLRRLTDELTTLLRQELALATTEISRSMRVLLGGAASVAAGGAVLFMGLLAMLAAAVLGLATVLQPWLAALVIGAAVALIGVVLVLVGIRSLDPSTLKPARTAESLRREKDVITRRQS